MPTTTRHALPSPASSAAPNVPVDVKALADAADVLLPYISTVEPAKISGLIWRNPTTGQTQITDGSSWFAISPTPWTTYTPTWTGVTTNPVLGNGTLAGAWTKVGRNVTVRVNLLMGTTTTYGSGAWQFALPEAAKTVAGFTTYPIWVGSAYCFDNGSTNRHGCSRVESGASVLLITSETTAQWQSTIPQTWTTSDMLTAQITYESAA